MRVEVDVVAEGLDGNDDARDQIFPRQDFKIDREAPDSRPAEFPKEQAPELEEDLQRLGHRQDHLAVRNAQE